MFNPSAATHPRPDFEVINQICRLFLTIFKNIANQLALQNKPQLESIKTILNAGISSL